MKLITFGLGGTKTDFLRMGWGSSFAGWGSSWDRAPAQSSGGMLKGQFRPAIFNPPILLDVRVASRVCVRIRFRSRSVVAMVPRVRCLTPPCVRIGDGGYVRGGRGERAFREFQRTVKDLNCIAAMVDVLCRRYANGRTRMTEHDRQLLDDTCSYLRTTMGRFQILADQLAEPRHLTVEARAYEVLVRTARDEQVERDARDARDLLVVRQAVEAMDLAQCGDIDARLDAKRANK